MGVVAQTIEARGIPTATISMEEGMAAPRVGRVPFPYNYPMGTGGRGQHRRVLVEALELIHRLRRPGEEPLAV